MKHFVKWMMLVLPILAAFVCSGCSRGERISGDESEYMIYYLNAGGNQLVGSGYDAAAEEDAFLYQQTAYLSE